MKRPAEREIKRVLAVEQLHRRAAAAGHSFEASEARWQRGRLERACPSQEREQELPAKPSAPALHPLA